MQIPTWNPANFLHSSVKDLTSKHLKAFLSGVVSADSISQSVEKKKKLWLIRSFFKWLVNLGGRGWIALPKSWFSAAQTVCLWKLKNVKRHRMVVFADYVCISSRLPRQSFARWILPWYIFFTAALSTLNSASHTALLILTVSAKMLLSQTQVSLICGKPWPNFNFPFLFILY